MDGIDDLRREAEALQRESDDLEAKLKARSRLVGEEVEAISDAEVAALRARSTALTERVENFRFESLPGAFGWLSRRHGAWGSIAAIALGLMNAWSISRFDGVRLAFIEVAAQVLPVLFIAIALEGRLMGALPKRVPFIRAYYATFVSWAIVGEVAALIGLAAGSASPLIVGLTGSAIASTIITLALMFVVSASVSVER